MFYFFFFSSRRRHTRFLPVSWARRCVQETAKVIIFKVIITKVIITKVIITKVITKVTSRQLIIYFLVCFISFFLILQVNEHISNVLQISNNQTNESQTPQEKHRQQQQGFFIKFQEIILFYYSN
eukprot:TRINITY_DN5902_c0_g2_i14.p1 TRINITY_DN5902_c0_g2~~TRINITY_DN5902_c0_g2_i14.p1  ORF type:complete len:125 (+),score=11.39 TRINITY_DN5902_c0_g2_i14:22-396(+)